MDGISLRITEPSTRALQYGFAAQAGMSTMAYLRQVRLQRADADLRAADGSDRGVARIASRWGVHQLRPVRRRLPGALRARAVRDAAPGRLSPRTGARAPSRRERTLREMASTGSFATANRWTGRRRPTSCSPSLPLARVS